MIHRSSDDTMHTRATWEGCKNGHDSELVALIFMDMEEPTRYRGYDSDVTVANAKSKKESLFGDCYRQAAPTRRHHVLTQP